MSEIVVQGTTPGIRVSGSGAQVTVKVTTGSGGGGGVTDHNLLSGRSDPDQHPIGAVTGLQTALAGKVGTSDSRLSDARTPTAHKTSHATGGTDALTPADIGAAASSHTHAQGDVTGLVADLAGKVGTGDSRLSDARTPTAHAASHTTGGTDALTPADIGAAEETHAHAAADVTSGVIAPARLGTGTADATTVLHGDGTWGTVGGTLDELHVVLVSQVYGG